MLAQFLDNAVAPLAAKSSLGEVIPPATDPKNYAKHHQTHEDDGDSTRPR
jgi:hypothetical protein